MARLIAALAGVLALFLGIASPANAALSAGPCSATAYTYNDPHHSSDGSPAQTARRPPAAFDRDPSYGAVDRWSRGASASSGHGVARAMTTYDDNARLVLVALTTSTARERAEGGGRALTSFARSGVAANTGSRLADDAFEHGYKYHPRIRERGLEDPRAHNFPYSFDDVILREKPITQTDGSLLYRKPGEVNGRAGIYEIALNPETGTIFHRTWRRTP